MHAVARLVSLCALVLLTAAPASSAQRIHTVANGQTLGGIAKRYGISVAELREANQLPQGVALKLGQRLLVPSPGEMEKVRRLQSLAKSTTPMATDPEGPKPEVDPAPAIEAADSTATTNGTPVETNPADGGAPSTETVSDDDTGAEKPDATSRPGNAASPARQGGIAAGAAKARVKRSAVSAEHRTHIVAAGHTLGKLAKRYHVKIESLCAANGLSRHSNLKLGQKLVIPNGDDDPLITLGPDPSESRDSDAVERHDSRDADSLKEMSVPGAGPVYYYEPSGHGRQSMRPIVVYLHGRGGDAEADCRRWSRIARRFGWLLCPSGPTPHNSGRTWNNNWVSGQHAVMGAVQGLRNLYGRRVQLYGNTLVGFSEGAYVAMNVGVRQPRTFNRWMILGADVSYWGGAGLEALKDAKSKVKRVVLITGGRDMVVDDTRTVAGWLENEGVTLRIQTPGDLAHEVALDRKPELYVSALNWLDNGGPQGKHVAQAKRH